MGDGKGDIKIRVHVEKSLSVSVARTRAVISRLVAETRRI